MPSDSNGVYSLPSGYLAVTGETIQASQHNPPLEDIATAMTARMPRSGASPMLGPVKIVDGTVGNPGLQFATAGSTGVYKTTDGFAVSVGGTEIAEFKAAGVELSKTMSFKDGGDVASAGALTLGDGNIFNITGTTAITSIATKGIGTLVWLRFAGSLTLTYHATDLIIQSAANITTAAGDWCVLEEYATGDWRMISYHRATGVALRSSLPRGYIDGCTLSNGTDATNDINIAAGVCRDSTNTVDITVAAMSGKQLDANWAPGAAAGMRNSAAGITNTTYHIYAVAKSDGTQDIYAHTSTTVATVITALQAESGGADYVYARRIGSIIRASAAILAFSQYGDEFLWSTAVLDVSAASQTSTATLRALTVPSGVKVYAVANVQIYTAGAIANCYISSPDQSDQASVAIRAVSTSPLNTLGAEAQRNTGSATATTAVAEIKKRTNTSAQLRFRCDVTQTLDVATIGYWDSRGKDS